MKTKSNFALFLLIFSALFVGSCTVEVIDDDTADPNNPIALNKMETFGRVYGEITFEGSALGDNCNNVKVTLSNATVTRDLDIIECTETSIVAWIPEDMIAGSYNVTLDVDGDVFTAINGEDMAVEVTIRPVILTLSTTTIEAGGTLEITGLYIVNNSTMPSNDPKVWLMKTNYTNTVSEITVNEEGTAATIIIDEDVDPDVYRLLLTCEDWSNEISLTIN